MLPILALDDIFGAIGAGKENAVAGQAAAEMEQQADRAPVGPLQVVQQEEERLLLRYCMQKQRHLLKEVALPQDCAARCGHRRFPSVAAWPARPGCNCTAVQPSSCWAAGEQPDDCMKRQVGIAAAGAIAAVAFDNGDAPVAAGSQAAKGVEQRCLAAAGVALHKGDLACAPQHQLKLPVELGLVPRSVGNKTR